LCRRRGSAALQRGPADAPPDQSGSLPDESEGDGFAGRDARSPGRPRPGSFGRPHPWSPGRPRPWSFGRPRPRVGLAHFLIGSAFAPFVIGLIQALLWAILPGQSLLLYAVIQYAWVAAALCYLRGAAFECLGESWRAVARSWRRKVGTVLALAAILWVAWYAGDFAVRVPHRHDAFLYALDGRLLAEGRSWSAALGLEPDAQNRFRYQNHGRSYVSYLSASLLYGPDPCEDLPLRVAQVIMAPHVLAVLLGLGLLVSWTTGLLAPLLLLNYHGYGDLVRSESIDFYRILALLTIPGLALGGREWPGLNWRGALVALGSAFFLNAHNSGLLHGPCMLACLLLVVPGIRPRAALVAIFLLGSLCGGYHMALSTLSKGSPLADSPFYNPHHRGTPVAQQWYEERDPAQQRWKGPVRQLGRAARVDGKFLARLLALALLAAGAWSVAAWRRPARWAAPDPLLLVLGAFLLLSALEVAGAFDFLNERLSPSLSMNYRYRAHFYPFAAVVIAGMLALGLRRLTKRALWLPLLAGLLAVTSLHNAREHWLSPDDLPVCLTRQELQEAHAAHPEAQSYASVVGYLREIPRSELVLMDHAYLGWYLADNQVMSTFDPRLRDVFHAAGGKEATRVLDSLRVRYVFMMDLEYRVQKKVNAPLVRALDSPAFRLIAGCPGAWRFYERRMTALPSAAELDGLLAADLSPEERARVEFLFQAVQDSDANLYLGPVKSSAQAVRQALLARAAAGKTKLRAADKLAAWLADSVPETGAYFELDLGGGRRWPLALCLVQLLAAHDAVAAEGLPRIPEIALPPLLQDTGFGALRRLIAAPRNLTFERLRQGETKKLCSGAELAELLRKTAALRDVPLDRPAAAFVGELRARSPWPGEEYLVREGDGRGISLEDWLARAAEPGP
jgi:hypothetical protein